MASSIPSILGRKLLPAAAMAVTATVTSGRTCYPLADDSKMGDQNNRSIRSMDGSDWRLWYLTLRPSSSSSPSRNAMCDAPSSSWKSCVSVEKNKGKTNAQINNPFLMQGMGIRETVLRKRVSDFVFFRALQGHDVLPCLPYLISNFSFLSTKKSCLDDIHRPIFS